MILSHRSKKLGITALGELFVGFGAAFIDLDRDADLDLLVANGHVINYPSGGEKMIKQPPLVLVNDLAGDKSRRFISYVDFPEGNYFAGKHRGRGLALGDLDGDLDQDMVYVHTNDPASVIRSDTVNENGQLKVRFVGVKSNRDAIGVIATLHSTPSGPAAGQQRQVMGGRSYLSQCDLACYWGVPAGDRIEKLVVRWPSGVEQTISADQLPLNRSLTFVEPD